MDFADFLTSPYSYFRRVWLGFHEMGTYLDEYIINKPSKAPEDDGVSLEKNEEQNNLLNSLIESHMQSLSKGGLAGLIKQQIIGIVFNSLNAGHETTGSTLFHCMINLALHPAWQRRVQADMEAIFGHQEPSQWDYRHDLEKLTMSSLDAAVSETLRVYPPNNLVPKHSVQLSGPPVTLKRSNIEVNVPANSRLLTLMVSTYCNSNYWPQRTLSTSTCVTDMGKFKRERWFVTPAEAEQVGGRSIIEPRIFELDNKSSGF
ncbi:hypothetical protein IFR04_004082 [Cadophora malorum]|uniref:Cytochrome P450 n=1 Tax=Cadophora malorum TaxID=108018 RepID=A0A8H7WDC0_9HELO|nr:hypothetical protein IFR04_004082 [Cadophora malorum]